MFVEEVYNVKEITLKNSMWCLVSEVLCLVSEVSIDYDFRNQGGDFVGFIFGRQREIEFRLHSAMTLLMVGKTL